MITDFLNAPSVFRTFDQSPIRHDRVARDVTSNQGTSRHRLSFRLARPISIGLKAVEALAREATMEWLMIDSTIVRAHSQAAGPRKTRGRMSRVLGRSWGRVEHKG